jgi:RNA:NAD 2'-phosphotransferase (TPT1/KptA family)
MRCLEGSGVPVLYIGRTIPKGSQGRRDSVTCSQFNKLVSVLLGHGAESVDIWLQDEGYHSVSKHCEPQPSGAVRPALGTHFFHVAAAT